MEITMAEQPPRTFRIPIQAEVQGDIRVLPLGFYFGRAAKLPPNSSRELQVCAESGAPLAIDSVTTNRPDIVTLETEVLSSSTLRIAARLRKPSTDGEEPMVVVQRESSISPELAVPVILLP